MDRYNDLNTSLVDLHISELPQEVQDQYYEFVSTVPLIKEHLDPNMPECKDLPKDNKGRIIVDVTKPHRLRDMDYFREAALCFKENGYYTRLKPNRNPNSEFGKWFRTEIDRCINGMVRPEDGEWITGDYYFFLNYCPMLVNEVDEDGVTNRVMSFPAVWECHYYRFHYLLQARQHSKHAAELASRSRGKSYTAAAMLVKRLLLGESKKVSKKVTSYIVAFDKSKLTGGDQTLDKVSYTLSHCAKYTSFPSKKLKNSMSEMEWRVGYKDLDTGAEMGSLNAIVGKTLEDEGKLRGSRGVLYLFEEGGSFKNLLASWNNLRPSVEDGDKVFGILYAFGTAGDDDSDFASLQELLYYPDGYNIYKVSNVFDKEGLGRKNFAWFTPAYLNYAGCYDKDGNSDVSKSLIRILLARYNVKYNSSDVKTITKQIAEWPITPQEAVLKTNNNMFPVADISARIAEIDSDPSFFDNVYVGTLTQSSTGEVFYTPTTDTPIRDFPTKNNKVHGALEIYEMPVGSGKGIPYNRYIVSLDNYENDTANTMSLGSMFVLDTWTDRIVAEYTGRPDFIDDLNELVRKTCIFYNAKCCYESNKKVSYAYFKKMGCLHLLADTPEWLKNKELTKSGYGNTSKGVTATAPIIRTGFSLIKDWLMKPVQLEETDEDGNPIVTTNLHFVKNRALLREMSLYNPDANFDRLLSMVQLMLYREEIITNAMGVVGDREHKVKRVEDPFFAKYDRLVGRIK